MPTPTRISQLTMLLVAVCLSGCAAAPNANDGVAGSEGKTAFGNFLVLAIADNYNNRAQFERTVVSNLKKEGADATTYYSAAGGNKPVDRDSAKAIMESGTYDALLVTRVLAASSAPEMKTGSAAAKATRRDDRPLDFFRYDYEELDEPGTLEISAEVTLSVELYRASDTVRVWSTELTSKDKGNTGAMIDDIAGKVVSMLSSRRRIAR